MKKLVLFLAVLWGAGAFGVWYWNDARTQRVVFRTTAVRRGDLQATVNATGTIEPEEVVDVGAQIAGEIQSFGPDPRDESKPISYGSPVNQGTILARLDDALLKARRDQAAAGVAKAEADVQQSEAKLRQAERDLNRQRGLRKKGAGMTSDQEYDTAVANQESAEAALSVAQGAVKVAQANLDEAVVNLGYTTIRSPVKGVILDRRVNIGQTVIASLNAPSLFLIAKDLSRMQIWASVNETDVGQIHVGQAVQFTVSAFPRESFPGKVAQIRLNASMVQNVVTYTVVVDVDNPRGKLLPYLTARLQFEVESRRGVLIVPNAALRWQPKPDLVAPDARGEYAKLRANRPASSSGAGSGDAARPTPGAESEGVLWVRRGDFVRPLPVRVGLSDGASTEVRGDGLGEGTEVIVGVVRQESDDALSILPHAQALSGKDKDKDQEADKEAPKR
jgi:HlyD family secretion protein